MKRGMVLTAFVSSITSTLVTAVVMLAILPAAVDAQVARTTAQGLTVVRPDSLQGMTVDVKPEGGGWLKMLGTDGKTSRIELLVAGIPPASTGLNARPSNPAAAGVQLNDINGQLIGRFGTLAGSGAAVGLQLWDGAGNVRYRASLDDDGSPTIKMFDQDGNVTWSAP